MANNRQQSLNAIDKSIENLKTSIKAAERHINKLKADKGTGVLDSENFTQQMGDVEKNIYGYEEMLAQDCKLRDKVLKGKELNAREKVHLDTLIRAFIGS